MKTFFLCCNNKMFLKTSSFAQSSLASKTGFERLFLEDVAIVTEGYVFIYVSNEEQQGNIAYFDDVTIKHKHSPVLQADDYYPFGLTFNSYQRSYSKVNNFKYNGFEEQVEWGVYDYQARYYDPALGRFLNVDPAADLIRRHSLYNYAFDNPIRFIDPDGMVPEDVVEECDGCPGEMQTYSQDNILSGMFDWFKGVVDNVSKNIGSLFDSDVSGEISLPSDESIKGNTVTTTGNPNDIKENGVVLTSEDDNGIKDQTKAKNHEVINADNFDPEKTISDFFGFTKNDKVYPQPIEGDSTDKVFRSNITGKLEKRRYVRLDNGNLGSYRVLEIIEE